MASSTSNPSSAAAGGGYFSNMKSSELAELQTELNSMKADDRREAAKQVIAMMTIGKDVSSLFPHMVKCMETTQIDMKKLVYLYIINYAKAKPDLTIMAVNSFQKDSREKTNPLMRALAVRTMGCIRVERITEYLCESLKDCLTDEDPYVKKTAALAVAKLFQTSPRLVKDHALVKIVQGMLLDGNATVVANACASLLEVSRASGKNYLRIKSGSSGNLNKILAALNDANEWGKIYIMEGISSAFETTDAKESEHIIERVVPMLTHNNPAVILSAVKAVLKFMDNLATGELSKGVVKKLAAPLVTLLASEAEIQYVALRNINFILQRQPTIFEQNVRVFFCKFNDPVYVKLEKIDILVKVADDKNADVILNELKEYANDIELELIRKSIRTIGTIILRVDKAAKRAVEILQEIVTTGQPICLQEAVVVARDIFRKFPNKYESLIKDLCAKLMEYYEPDAKAAIIWIIGEYAEKITDAEKLIDGFAEGFLEEPDKVKLQLLTAAVKLFLKKPEEGEDTIQRVLKLATEEADSPDLRDRAYIYWRMLSTSPQNTKYVVLGEKPHIAEDSYNQYDDTLVTALIDSISTLSSVYHKTPEELALMQRRLAAGQPAQATLSAKKEEEKEQESSSAPATEKVAPQQMEQSSGAPAKASKKKTSSEEPAPPKAKPKKVAAKEEEKVAPVAAPTTGGIIDIDDLLGMGDAQVTPSQSQTQQQNNFLGGLDFGGGSQPAQNFGNPFGGQDNDGEEEGSGWATMGAFTSGPSFNLDFAAPALIEVVSSQTKGQGGRSGLQIKAAFTLVQGALSLDVEVNNFSGQQVADFDVMFNKNPFGLALYGAANGLQFPRTPQETVRQQFKCSVDKKNLDSKNPPKHPFKIQVALKSSLDVYYFEVPCMLHCLIDTANQMKPEEFRKFWEMIPKSNETSMAIDKVYGGYTSTQFNGGSVALNMAQGLQANGFVNLAKVPKKDAPGTTMLYFGAKTINNLPLMVEVAAVEGAQNVNLLFRVPVLPLKPLLEEALDYIISADKRQ